MSQQKGKCFAVVRIRGRVKVPDHLAYTLKTLNLTRTNHATLIAETVSSLGILREVKEYITWGEASKNTIISLLKERAELKSGIKLTEKNMKEKLGYDSIEKLAEAIYTTEIKLNKIQNLKPFFRLHPPKHGLKGKRIKSFAAGGETGYRGEVINNLITRMI